MAELRKVGGHQIELQCNYSAATCLANLDQIAEGQRNLCKAPAFQDCVLNDETFLKDCPISLDLLGQCALEILNFYIAIQDDASCDKASLVKAGQYVFLQVPMTSCDLIAQTCNYNVGTNAGCGLLFEKAPKF